MTPLELRVRNFMSYREEAVLDFSRLRVACFSGDNGAGKSALLDAITWALWGKTRASSDRDVIAIGETEMEVTFTFRLHDREFRVFRRRTAGSASRQSLEFDTRLIGELDWVSITGDSVRQTERKIVETLNLDYDTFVNSAFILQGRADSFAQIGPTDRKRILAEILNLGEYDALAQLARDDERLLRSQLQHAESRRDALDAALAERPARMAELEQTSRRVIEVGEQLDRTTQLLQAINAQIASWEQLRLALAAASEREARARKALGSIEDAIRDAESRQAAHAALLAEADAIEAGAAAHQHWRAEAARLAEVLIHARAAEQERDLAEREIERAEAELRRTLEGHAARRVQLCESLAAREREAAELPQLHARAHEHAATLARLPQVREELRLAREERARLRAENAELKRRMEEIKESLEKITAGRGNCPVCRAPLSDADRERIAAEWTADGTALGDAFRENKRRIADLDEGERRLIHEEEDLLARDRERTTLAGLIERATAAADECTRLSTEIARLDEMIAPIARSLDVGAFAEDARERRRLALARLAELGYDCAAHDQAINAEREYEHFEQRKRELDRARIEHAGLDQQLTALRAQATERRAEAEQAAAETRALETQLAGQPDLRRQADELQDVFERLDRERSELQAAFGRAQGALEELDRLAHEREEVAERIQTLALNAGALRELMSAFGSNGIQAMIVESVLPELEREANEVLRRMSSAALRVAFRSQRQAISVDKLIETLDIVIRDEYGERPYALYSGGEAFRINFAVRVALSKVLARRAGSRIDILVIDEGFGSLDGRGRDGLIEALRSIEADFGTIVVITHLSEIRELFPTRVDITKTERGSVLSIVDS